MEKIQAVINADGSYTCEVNISTEEWKAVLSATQITPKAKEALLAFYAMPDYKASCMEVSRAVYGDDKHYRNINAAVVQFGRAARSILNRVEIVGEGAAWLFPMGWGKKVDNLFVWQMRPELAAAVKASLVSNKTALASALNGYKAYFPSHWELERYKWEAVRNFQEEWDIDAADFSAMLEKAFSKVKNLLNAARFYPLGTIKAFAKVAPEDVRAMFRRLYDEEKSLFERIGVFQSEAERLRSTYNDGTWKSHYQNNNSISVYLWLRYPDKYYIYKSTEYKKVASLLSNVYKPKRSSSPLQVVLGYLFYDAVCEELQKDAELLALVKATIDGESLPLYADPELRTLTVDFGFYISRYYDDDTKQQSITNETKKNMDRIDKYIDLLKANHNLIFTGAPGTGKTFTAKEMANRMGGVCKQVQFHPSYDYTDFVEGLRPTTFGQSNGAVGFRREDGIFKEFCKKALLNSEIQDSGDIFSELNDSPKIWKVSLEGTGDNPTRTDCLDNGHIRIGWGQYGDVEDFNDYEDYSDGGKAILKAFQTGMQIGDLVVSCYSAKETDAIGIITGDYEYRKEGGAYPRYRTVKWLVKNIRYDIRELNDNRMLTLSTVYRLYWNIQDVIKVVRSLLPAPTTLAHNQPKPYVFIIDEINRGEISKIFGELFFSIEPSYRGEKERVQTQYQSLIEEGDVFKDGFFIPENVYIIGTMNNIDRSVESMDFAMRRRFVWQEITAAESADNMGISGENRERMDRLNKAIADTDGLGKDYQIGGAQFLKVEEGKMTPEELWRLNLQSLMKEYLRGLPNAGENFRQLEKVYMGKDESEADDVETDHD